MVKNVIFDIGDVLVGYNSENYSKQVGLEIDNVNKANDILIKSSKWSKYLNGDIKVEELINEMNNKFPYLKQEFKLLLEKENTRYIIYEIKRNTDLLKKLSEKHNIYLLSNITKETLECIQQEFDFTKYIKGGVYSYQEHISKPNKQIFKNLINRYKLETEETIYIDDKNKNVEVAKQLGMIGIVCTREEPLDKIIGGVLN